MTDELTLYQTNKPLWLEMVGPKMAGLIPNYDDATLAATWADMGRDYQTATWKHLDEVSRDRVRRVRG